MQKIEDFINRRFAEELEHIADGIDQPKPEAEAMVDQWFVNDTPIRLSSKPIATFQMNTALFGATSVEYWKQREEEAFKLRERLLTMTGGDVFVARADRLAAEAGIDWSDAARITAVADAVERFRLALMSPEVQAAVSAMIDGASKAFAQLAQGIADGLAEAGIDQPRNRHERRAKKHAVPLEPDDPDQRWKSRDYRSRRNS